MPAIGIDQIKPGNSLMVSPGNYGTFSTLQEAYNWLASSDRDAEMGAASNENRRTLILSPGLYTLTDMLVLDTPWVDITSLTPTDSKATVVTMTPALSVPLTIASGATGVSLGDNNGYIRVTGAAANAFSDIYTDYADMCVQITDIDAPTNWYPDSSYSRPITGIDTTDKQYIDLGGWPYVADRTQWYCKVIYRGVIEVATYRVNLSGFTIRNSSAGVWCCLSINYPEFTGNFYGKGFGDPYMYFEATDVGLYSKYDENDYSSVAQSLPNEEIYFTGGADSTVVDGWYSVLSGDSSDNDKLRISGSSPITDDTDVHAWLNFYEDCFENLFFENYLYPVAGQGVFGFSPIGGTWINCHSACKSWRFNAYRHLRARMYSCSGPGRSFTSDWRGTEVGGLLFNCYSFSDSGAFGGCDNFGCKVSATLIGCKGQDHSFAMGAEFSGSAYHCIAGETAFAGSNATGPGVNSDVTVAVAGGKTLITKDASAKFNGGCYYGQAVVAGKTWAGRLVYITGTGVISDYYEIESISDDLNVLTIDGDITTGGFTDGSDWALCTQYGTFSGIAVGCVSEDTNSFGAEGASGSSSTGTRVNCWNGTALISDE
jgi:hypothetical protein